MKSETITVWVYRDGEWEESGKTTGPVDTLERRIAIRLTEDSYELYSIDESGHVKYTSPDLPHLIVLAPVCRPGWLIETECIAVVPTESSFKPL